MTNPHAMTITTYHSVNADSGKKKECPCCGQVLPDWYAELAISAGLTKMESDIFFILANASGRVVTKDEIALTLWGDEKRGWPKSAENNMAVFVVRANKKLASIGFYIGNVWGRGYRLLEQVTTPSQRETA